MENKREKELAEIALRYIEKEYTMDNLMDGDDLYDAEDDERERCRELFLECRKTGIIAFGEKYSIG